MSTAEVTAIETKNQTLSREKVELLKRTYCKGASDDELELFLTVSRSKGLDPFSGQIHAVKRWDSALGKNTIKFQVGIDGLRLIAERTGLRDGTDPPEWCDADGNWVQVWTKSEPPTAARVVVYKKGQGKPHYGIADFAMFAQRDKHGNLTRLWARSAAFMLRKCAEANALREAHPQETAGLYIHEEMQQAGSPISGAVAAIEKALDACKSREDVDHVVARIQRLSDSDKDYIRPLYRMTVERITDAEIDQCKPQELEE